MLKKTKKVICRNCNRAIPKNVKICPYCGAKNKKPFYKRAWFRILLIIAIIGAVHSFYNYGYLSFLSYKMIKTSLDKAKEETTISTETTAAASTEITTENQSESAETKSQTNDSSTELVDGLRPDFKKAMDSYEEFMNEYCDFMTKYADSDGTDIGLIAEYADYMSKYSDMVKDFDAWNDEELNNAELSYYLDVQNRINKKFLEISD